MPRRRRGGPRTPSNPRLHSGPGATSSRTDGAPSPTQAPRVSDAPPVRHGEGQVVEGLEQAGRGGGGAGAIPGGQGGPPGAVGPFNDPFAGPTERPGEDPLQPLNDQPPTPSPEETARQATDQIDATTIGPMLPILEAIADRPGSTVALRNVVRRARSLLPPEFDIGESFSLIQQLEGDVASESPSESPTEEE